MWKQGHKQGQKQQLKLYLLTGCSVEAGVVDERPVEEEEVGDE